MTHYKQCLSGCDSLIRPHNVAAEAGATINTVAADNLQSLRRTRTQLSVRSTPLISSLTRLLLCADFFFITQLNDLVVLT